MSQKAVQLQKSSKKVKKQKSSLSLTSQKSLDIPEQPQLHRINSYSEGNQMHQNKYNQQLQFESEEYNSQKYHEGEVCDNEINEDQLQKSFCEQIPVLKFQNSTMKPSYKEFSKFLQKTYLKTPKSSPHNSATTASSSGKKQSARKSAYNKKASARKSQQQQQQQQQEKCKANAAFEPFKNKSVYPLPIQAILKLKTRLSVKDIYSISRALHTPFMDHDSNQVYLFNSQLEESNNPFESGTQQQEQAMKNQLSQMKDLVEAQQKQAGEALQHLNMSKSSSQLHELMSQQMQMLEQNRSQQLQEFNHSLIESLSVNVDCESQTNYSARKPSVEQHSNSQISKQQNLPASNQTTFSSGYKNPIFDEDSEFSIIGGLQQQQQQQSQQKQQLESQQQQELRQIQQQQVKEQQQQNPCNDSIQQQMMPDFCSFFEFSGINSIQQTHQYDGNQFCNQQVSSNREAQQQQYEIFSQNNNQISETAFVFQ